MTKRKITGFLTCTNPMEFLKGRDTGLSIFDHKTTVDGWFTLGEHTFEIDIDYDAMTEQILADLDKLEKEIIGQHELQMETIKEKRATFLALAAPIDNPAPEEDDGLDPNDPPF